MTGVRTAAPRATPRTGAPTEHPPTGPGRGDLRGGLADGTALVVIALLAVLPAALLALRGRFDGLYGQDAFAYYDYAVGPLRERLLGLRPPPPFYWPPGYPILVALASFVVGTRPLAGQIVSLVAAGVVAVGTALLAREVVLERSGEDRGSSSAARDPRAMSHARRWFVPLVAGLVVACTGQLWQSAVVVMADTSGLACITLAAWAIARYRRRGRLGWLLFAAVAAAWATVTRWIYGLVAVPLALAALAFLFSGRIPRRTAVWHGLAAAAASGAILAPVLGPALAGLASPTASIAPAPGQDAGSGLVGSAPSPPSFNVDFQVYSWSPLNAARNQFTTADGDLRYRFPNGLYYALAPGLPVYFTPLLALLVPFGLWATLRRRPGPLALSLVGWAAVVYAFHAGAPWQNFRFTLAYLPPLAILVAFGAAFLARRLGPGRGVRPAPGRRLAGAWPAPLLVGVGLCWMVVAGARLTQAFIDRKQADLETVRWVEAQLPPDARLLTFGLTATFRQYSPTETFDLFEIEPARLPDLLAHDGPTYVLLDVAGVEQQWQGRAPSANYHWLEDQRGLEPLGQRAGYTLFEVRRPSGTSAPVARARAGPGAAAR
jgi:4-amino-4-deoxy-L-arabinose transferase-like glycosyltransferase